MLDWLAGPGFAELADEHDWDWKSAGEFRQRHLANVLADVVVKILRG